MKGEKSKLEDLSVDDFMAEGLDPDSGAEDQDDDQEMPDNTKSHEKDEAKSSSKEMTKSKEGRVNRHKQSMKNLEENDPEFYEYLKKEDNTLLNFADSDLSDDDDESESEEEGVGEREIAPPDEDENDEEQETEKEKEKKEVKGKKLNKEMFHKVNLKKKLEMSQVVESDEEDFKEDDNDIPEEAYEDEDHIKVTLAMIDSWDVKMQNGSLGAFQDVVRALSAAVNQIQKKPAHSKNVKFIIKGSATFNAIVKLCLNRVYPLLQTSLGMKIEDVKRMKLPSAMKTWSKVNFAAKSYLVQLMQLMEGVSDPQLVAALLRHVHKMIPYFACFPIATKIVKTLVDWWSMAEERVRILAFVCLYSLSRHLKNMKLDFILKKMYMSYVRNTCFTSPNTLPVIMFMQHSITEMFALDTKIAYQHAFVYIRQLAIHLRNAMTIKKKDAFKTVYNWQYIHCIHLWCRILGTLHQDDNLRPLIYPLVQTSIGVIKLIPAAKYFPIRFHIIRSLNTLSDATGVFIPLLPLLTEVFDITNFNQKHSTMSFKPYNFAVMLRLSKSQMLQNGFRDGLIDQVFDLILEVCQTQSHTIGFPELTLSTVLRMKAFNKTCKVANFTRQIKQLLDKIQENSKFIEKKRALVTFNVSDDAAIKAWESKNILEGTPLSTYYKTYRNLRERQLRIADADADKAITPYYDETPTLTSKRRKAIEAKERVVDNEELKQIFNEDDDSDDDLMARAKRREDQRNAGVKSYALVRANLAPDSEDDGEGESSDEGSSDEPKEEEEEDLERFKQKKTQIVMDMVDVKDVVEDFKFSSDEEDNEADRVKDKKKLSKGTGKGKKPGVATKRRKIGGKPVKRQKVK